MASSVLEITIAATSVLSGSKAAQNFNVTFLSGCENMSLISAPIVMTTSYTTIAFQLMQIPFNAAVAS